MTIDERLQQLYPDDPDAQYAAYRDLRDDITWELLRSDMAITTIARDLAEIHARGNACEFRLMLCLLAEPFATLKELSRRAGYRHVSGAAKSLSMLRQTYPWLDLLIRARSRHIAETASARRMHIPGGQAFG